MYLVRLQHCQRITVQRLDSDIGLRLFALLLPLPTQSRSTVVPVTSRSGVLKGWTIRTNADKCEFTLSVYVVVVFFLFFYSYEYSYWNDQISTSIVWRVTGQSPGQYVQPAGWWESSHHSLHAAGSFDRGYCSMRKEIYWSQFAPKYLVLCLHFSQNSLLCGWSYVCRTTVVSYYCPNALCTRTHFNYT